MTMTLRGARWTRSRMAGRRIVRQRRRFRRRRRRRLRRRRLRCRRGPSSRRDPGIQIHPRVLVSLADRLANALEASRLLAAEPSTGLGRRLLNAVFGWKLDSKAEASVTTLDNSKSDGRRLLKDTSPVDTFLEALRDMVDQTDWADNVRLRAVPEQTLRSPWSFPSFSKRATPRI